MSGFLLDTNCLSELYRPRPEPRVVAFLAAQSGADLFVSDATLAEIRFGIEQLKDVDRRTAFSLWLARTIRPMFEGRTLRLSEDVILRWRLMLEAGRPRGHTFTHLDLFIAASALNAGLIVVSRDTTHFIAAGAPCLDPWTGVFVDADGEAYVVPDMTSPGLLARLARL